MNYEIYFRILPWSRFFRYVLIFILVFQSVVNGDTVPAKGLSEVNNEDKSVFQINFSNKKTYAIDDCVPLAFGDFNADKIVDIFCRNTKGDTIRVMINDDRSPTSKEQCQVNITGIIYDALAADFDGDSKLDLFVLYKKKADQNGYNGGILWGDRNKLNDLQPLDYLFQNIPTTLDANGDSFVELLGMVSTDDGKNFKPACVYLQSRSSFPIDDKLHMDNLRLGSTQATVDLNNDLVADLFLTTDTDNGIKFRIFELPITNLKLINEYGPPPGATVFHLSTFADIDADGELEHILPVCMDTTCADSRIYVRDDNEWHPLPINFGAGKRFPVQADLPSPLNNIPFSVKVADYNLDGFPDIVTVMKDSATNNMTSIVLENQECFGNKTFCPYNRTFTPKNDEIFVLAITNATLAVFFDILENGYPDLLVLQGSANQNFRLVGFQNSLYQDVHFIKVMVISTFSCETCPRQKKLPYGNNQPGQSIKMETITIMNGIKDYWVKLAAVQMSQSGQLTLELPYVIIGLGPTPNFVEKLTVGVPPNSESNKLFRTYTQMIPNSQIVVVPSPINNPEKWHSKLFITPSWMILHTGIALGATLVVLAGALAVFQYREKVEDDRERKVQAQAFHYDAL